MLAELRVWDGTCWLKYTELSSAELSLEACVTSRWSSGRKRLLMCGLFCSCLETSWSEFHGCSAVVLPVNQVNWSNSRDLLCKHSRVSADCWQCCSAAVTWSWSYNLSSQAFCKAKFVNAFEILRGRRDGKKIIVCNTNSEKHLVKKTCEHTLDWKIKEAIKKILMKKELWEKQMCQDCSKSEIKEMN